MSEEARRRQSEVEAQPEDGHAAREADVPTGPWVTRLTTRLPLPPRAFTALRTRNYRLYWTGQVVSLSGTWMQTTAQNWLVYQLTLAPFAVGLLNFANQLPTLLFTLWAGVLADRVNKRKFVIATQTLAMLQAFTLAALVFSGQVRAEYVILLAFILGAINAFDNPTRQSLIPELVPKSDIMNAVALGSMAFNGARIIGPAIGGLVVATIGAGGAFAVNAFSFLAVLIGLLLMDAPARESKPRKEPVVKSLNEGFRYVLGNRAIQTLLLQAAMVGIFGIPYTTLMPVMAAEVLGLGVSGYGLLMSAVGVGAVIGAFTLASLGNYEGKGRLVTLGDFVFPTALGLFTFSRFLPLSMLLLAIMGAALIMRNAMTNTLIQTSVPDHLRGRVMAVYIVMFQGMTPLGALQSGWVAQHYGAPLALLVGVLALLISAALVVLARPEVRRMP